MSRTCSLFILGLAILADAVTAANYGCSGDNYTSKGTYSANLNSLISSLPPNIQHNGFYNATVGQPPDRVTCLREAVPELLRLCPNRRQDILFKDTCTLRYSDESLVDGAGSDSFPITAKSIRTASDPEHFNQNLWGLLGYLRAQAGAGGQLMKLAAGNETGSSSQTIFALVQCVPDLSEEGCNRCLINSEQNACCDSNTGMRLYMPACFIQYEVLPFYNITRIEEVRAIISHLPPPAPPPPSPPPPGNPDVVKTIIIILVPIFMALACVGRYVKKRFKKKTDQLILQGSNVEELEDISAEDVSAEESLLYDYEELVVATDNFSSRNKLGQGGFGAVYKGKLRSGLHIAVKRLSENSTQGELEFKNEVVLMAKLEHRNLVRLLGFSVQGSERLLVYEFVQNGSLDNFIFDPVKRLLISWESRYMIIKSIAKGLVYLHEGSPLRIIHRDLKASNILLDGDKTPKISDFGLARLFRDDQTRSNTRKIAGTFGYMAPEYAQNGDFSLKSDVFSFGVLVLEIISGQSTCNFKNVENGENIPYMLSYAWRNWFAGRAKKLMDPTLISSSTSLRDMMRCIHIGLLCVQKNARDRPTMASVLVMLHSFTSTLPMPLQPAFFVPNNEDMRRSLEITKLSENEASITDLYPR
ncbi:cysteine-rich receptor-like protein kinase 44 [Salvia hispanica]|uniref:cysteine-rich receptor-like protein kinase 44 n=1 Tax=Salvia hispanica TaxID=49212 RepID=UPI0020094559|nr:cysteine-rich receptor-like protein kinase 44 [Salvia hispanica]